MKRVILVSLFLTSSAFAGDRSLSQSNAAAPMYHTGEAAYAGYCPTDPAYCLSQTYGSYSTYRRTPRHISAHRTSIQRHRR